MAETNYITVLLTRAHVSFKVLQLPYMTKITTVKLTDRLFQWRHLLLVYSTGLSLEELRAPSRDANAKLDLRYLDTNMQYHVNIPYLSNNYFTSNARNIYGSVYSINMKTIMLQNTTKILVHTITHPKTTALLEE